MSQRRQAFGFTLLEILLVMVLLSLTAIVVVPTLPQKSDTEAKDEANRFYQLIQLWTEQSLIESKTMGVRVEDDRYRLMALKGNDWEYVQAKKRLATDISMPEGVELEIEVDGLGNDEDQLFSRESLFDETMFVEEEEEVIEPPQLVLMGNGEILPFTLLVLADGKEQWRVTGTDVGVFELSHFDEDKE